MLKEMGVTPGKQWEATLEQLNQYGSTAITSKGVVGNRAEVEMSTRLPQTSDGAISYLLDQILAELNKKELKEGAEQFYCTIVWFSFVILWLYFYNVKIILRSYTVFVVLLVFNYSHGKQNN